MVIVVMGPAGAGKSTVGRRLAEALGWSFIEGDDFHLPRSLAAMRAGHPLEEADRAPWLAALAGAIRAALRSGRGAVVAASALRRAHRAVLAPDPADGAVRFVYLRASPALLAERLARRRGHVAGPELLPSQLAALEPPTAAEGVLILDAALPPQRLVDQIRRALRPAAEAAAGDRSRPGP